MPKLLGEVQAGAVEPGLDRGLLDAENLRHVGDGDLHDLLEHEREAKFLGQSRDRLLDGIPALPSFEKLEGTIAGRSDVDHATVSRRQQLFERLQALRLARALAVSPLARSRGDSIEPRGGIGAPFELVPLSEREKKRVLNEIPGFVVVAAEAEPEGVQPSAVPLHELGDGDVRGSILKHGEIVARMDGETNDGVHGRIAGGRWPSLTGESTAGSGGDGVVPETIGVGYEASMTDTGRILITLGGLLLLGLATEAIGRRTRLPRVSLMLLFGFVFGRSVLGVIPDVTETWFPTISNMALVMVGFLLGEKLSRGVLREHGRLVLSLSVAVVLSTFLCVFLGMIAVGMPLSFALLLAGIAPATDPAASTDVVHEVRAKGPFTSALIGIVALDDAWGLLLFSVVLAAVEFSVGASGLAVLGEGLWHAGGAVLLGAGLGLPMAYLTGRIEPGEPTLAEALGSVLLCGGLALALDVSFLLAAMSMGVVVANLARHHERPFHAIEGIEWPFLVLFFLFAGTELQVTSFRETGVTLAIFVAARVVGRILGAKLGLGYGTGLAPGFATSMGLALMPQAGVALGMAILAVQRFPEFEPYLSLAIAATVLFELFGPLLTRRSLERMGEVGARKDGA